MTVPVFKGPYSLEKAFLKRSPDAHDFSGRFHLGREGVVLICEFIERKTRYFCYHVIKGGLE